MPWLSAIKRQAITWANVELDICRHMASLHNDLIAKYILKNFVDTTVSDPGPADRPSWWSYICPVYAEA